MNSSKLISCFNRFYIFLIVNYGLISQFVIHTDSSGYFLLFLSALVLLINSKAIANLQLSKPIVFWTIWCIFAFCNYHFRTFHESPMSFVQSIRFIFYPLLSMTIVAKEFADDQSGTIKWCFFAFLCYTIFGYVFDPGILYRELGEDNTLGNTYAITTSLCLFFLIMVKKKTKMNLLLFLIMTVLLIVVLAFSGTRKAFGAGVIMLVFWALSIFDIKKFRTWLFIGAFAVAGFWGYEQLMENTFMGQRMEYLEEQQEENLPSDAPKILGFFGDRAPHYYYGWRIFTAHPLFGVGPYQSRVGYGYPHTEYIAQLADNGIVGFTLYFLLYAGICSGLFKKRKYDKEFTTCLLGGFVAILFLSLTSWTWNYSALFCCLGVMIGNNKVEYNTDCNSLL